MRRQISLPLAPLSDGGPLFELRAHKRGAGDLALAIYQLPAPATPQIKSPIRLAGLDGAKSALIESRILKRLGEDGSRLARLRSGEKLALPLPEAEAARLVLLFRTLAPMRARDAMLACAAAIEALSREEASWWLGMVQHKKRPRR
ncbi:MAG: hypothetical protein RMK81_16135, partial [Geminicoccaceae bacterium]|nr:hypothetical protein [Geminicoccaceae bacterium]